MIARLAGASIVAACAFAAYRQPLSEATLALDAWYLHLLQGGKVPVTFGAETFAIHGAPTGAPGWLGAVITGSLAALSPYAVSILNGLLCATALGLLLVLCRPSGAVAAICAASLAGITSLDGFGTGTLGYEMIAALAFVALLRRADRNVSLLCIAVAIVWCNLATSGLMAGPLALAATIGAIVDERGTSPRLRRLVAIAFGSLAAPLCTPGFTSYASDWLVHLGFFDEKIEALTAWNPTSRPRALFFGIVPLLVTSAWIGWRRTRRLSDVLVCGTIVVASLADAALLPIAGIIVAYILAGALREINTKDLERYPYAVSLIPLGFAAAAVVLAVLAIAKPFAAERHVAANVAALLPEHARRLFCSQPAWCNFALGGPIAVYMDGRITAYPPGVRAATVSIAAANKSWSASLDRFKVDAVMTADDRPLASLLDIDRHWRRIPSEGNVALFVRNT